MDIVYDRLSVIEKYVSKRTYRLLTESLDDITPTASLSPEDAETLKEKILLCTEGIVTSTSTSSKVMSAPVLSDHLVFYLNNNRVDYSLGFEICMLAAALAKR